MNEVLGGREMRREFRGMVEGGEWKYGNLTIIEETEPARGFYISNSIGYPFAYKIRPETAGQFTGVKDKEGLKIFEHDRVYSGIRNKVGTVIFIPGRFVIKFSDGTNHTFMHENRALLEKRGDICERKNDDLLEIRVGESQRATLGNHREVKK